MTLQSLAKALLFVALLAPATATAQHVSLPPVDLGDTSFQDGVGGPGTLLQEILDSSYSGRLNGPHGESLPGNNSIQASASVSEIGYQTNKKFLGAFYGIEALLPVVHADVKTDLGVRGASGTMGDFIFSPLLLQWTGSKLFGKPISHRFDADFIFPTGRYNRNSSVNIGSHLVSVNPNYAFTLFLTPRLETSWRFHYLWNSRNNDPAPVFRASSIQPGQAVHFNAAMSYQVNPRLRAGIAGYYLKQITDPKVDGRAVFNAREQVGAIGPGLVVSTRPFDLYLHTFFEMGAENRPQGLKVVVRIFKVFPHNSAANR